MDLQLLSERKTPFYLYDLSVLKNTLVRGKVAADRHGFHIHYALKANTDSKILAAMIKNGIGADCVSGQEVKCALDAGFKPENIAFAGVGKTDDEIDFAIDAGLFTLNVESLEELEVISERATLLNKTANVALRLNPDVNAKTHHYITTGLEENKFGIGEWQLDDVLSVVRSNDKLNLRGLHFHIGSQITSLEPFKNLCVRINYFIEYLLTQGFHIQHINAGGGLGIDYNAEAGADDPDFESYFQIFADQLNLKPDQEVHFELGRSLVAHCGSLISRVLYVKKGQKTNFLILDAGMTELIRPALYQAFHRIENWSTPDAALEKYDVVGPVCESSDCFGKAIDLPQSKRGDIIAIKAAGAYGEAMASNYNLRKLNDGVYIG
jgi:diaminopimelate decarboxylase